MLSLILSSVLGLQTVFANDAIIGDDDRKDPSKIENSSIYHYKNVTLARIAKSEILVKKDEVHFNLKTLAEKGYCEDQKFSHQPAIASCTGFLVGEDILVTAGHCMETTSDCQNYSWVFNYELDANENLKKITPDQIYHCKAIIETKQSRAKQFDYAVIKLDHAFIGQIKNQVRPLEQNIEAQTPLVLIGHPQGLPTKIVDNGISFIRDGNNHFFESNIDALGGNSGGPVFNKLSGEIEGILVMGDKKDYIDSYDFFNGERRSCKKINTCTENDCSLQIIQNISAVKEIYWHKKYPQILDLLHKEKWNELKAQMTNIDVCIKDIHHNGESLFSLAVKNNDLNWLNSHLASCNLENFSLFNGKTLAQIAIDQLNIDTYKMLLKNALPREKHYLKAKIKMEQNIEIKKLLKMFLKVKPM